MLTINFLHFPLHKDDWVLDLGCGEGRHAIHANLQHNAHAVGVDLSQSDLLTAKNRHADYHTDNIDAIFSLQQADGTQLPFPDQCFDKIICSEVLEHIENYPAMLREIQRVLKPNGLLAVSVPRAWPEKICWRLSSAYHQVPGGHIRIFERQELESAVCSQGFSIYASHGAHALHAPFWWLKCWLWETQEQSRLIALYHRFLVWDLIKKPALTRILEWLLNPWLGKSIVLYFRKGQAVSAQTRTQQAQRTSCDIC